MNGNLRGSALYSKMLTAETDSGPVLTADAITDVLRKLILNGTYGVGVQLKQEALAKRFGVSRFPIRQALKRLEAEGLIEHTPFAGSVVASQSVSDLIQTLDIRIGLETRALALAIPHMTSKDFRAVEDIMNRYDASDLPMEWTELNLEFHLRLYQPCKRPKLLKMIEDIVRSVDIQLRTQQSYRLGRKSPQTEHRAIVQACQDKDVATATQLLQRHIEHTQHALGNEVD
jgi:DNA-binding GntR family transcriptional regulator